MPPLLPAATVRPPPPTTTTRRRRRPPPPIIPGRPLLLRLKALSLCLIAFGVVFHQLRTSRRVSSLLARTAADRTPPAATATTTTTSDPAFASRGEEEENAGEEEEAVVVVLPDPSSIGGVAATTTAPPAPSSSAIDRISQTTIATRPADAPTERSTPQQQQQQQQNAINTTGLELGERWIKDVRKMLRTEEKNRRYHLKPGKNQRKRRWEIIDSFKRVNRRFENVTASDVDDPANWHAVSRDGYLAALSKARASMDEMVDKVETDCVLWLVPPDAMTALEVEADDRNRSNWMKDERSRPLLRFQCGDDEDDDDRDRRRRDAPCSSASLCLVRSDPLEWQAYYAEAEGGESFYDHADLRRRLLAPPTPPFESEGGGPRSKKKKSAIITMVDSVRYLRDAQRTRKRKQPLTYYIWECFLSKASYALRTNRDLYIWIGSFEGDEATQSILHQRNNEVVSEAFGADCKPAASDKNVVHYYKPVAFGALFRKLRAQRDDDDHDDDDDEEHRAWFVDADIFFNEEAFSSAQSLDDYFGISPQASLLGAQNPSGKDDNILINGGLLGLRASAAAPADPLDDWILNLSALWWYCRCGERDQIALWLLLYATWSAESHGTPGGGLAYPRMIFENYIFAWLAVPPHARVFLPRLQSAWTRHAADSSSGGGGGWSTVPTNAVLFDGGDRFLRQPKGGGVYSYPLELPHVLLLPLDPFELPSSSVTSSVTTTTRSGFDLGLVLKDQPEKRALLTHAKNRDHVCYDFGCWPYLIRSGDGNPKRTTTTTTIAASSAEEEAKDDEEEGTETMIVADDDDDGKEEEEEDVDGDDHRDRTSSTAEEEENGRSSISGIDDGAEREREEGDDPPNEASAEAKTEDAEETGPIVVDRGRGDASSSSSSSSPRSEGLNESEPKKVS